MNKGAALFTRSLFFFLAVVLAGCSGGGGSSSVTPPPPPVPGFAVAPASLTVSESDAADTTSKQISFALQTRPASSVELILTVVDSSEVEIKLPTDTYWTTFNVSLIFTTENWNTPQYVDIRGVDDTVDDGNKTSAVNVNVFTADPTYSNVAKPTISVTTVDNDAPGVTADTGAAPLTTAEGSAATSSFTVRLNTPPTANVSVPVTVGDTSEGQIATTSGGVYGATIDLLFTPTAYGPKTVYIKSVDDQVADGNQTYTITLGKPVSSDTNYTALNPQTLSVTNSDNDTAGITVTAASPLMTAEYGTTASFTVKLNSEPTTTVVIPVTSMDVTEGLVSGGSAVAPAATLNLTFSPLNWTAAQTVTVQGQDDPDPGENPIYAINVGAATGAAEYVALGMQTVSVLNADDDAAGFYLSQTTLATSESGSSASFSLALNKAPLANVVFQLTGDLTEGSLQPSSLTFTPTDWQTAQTVSVTGQQDFAVDGNQTYIINVTPTGDADYASLAAQSVTVTNSDIDTAAYTVSKTSLSIAEPGGWPNSQSFTVALNSMPSASVTVPVSSGDIDEVLVKGGDQTASFVGALNLTFDSANWSTPQTVTVQGVDDYTIDGTQNAVIAVGATTSTDVHYDGLSAKSVAVTVSDSNSAGYTVSASTVTTGEGGVNSTFSVALNTIPVANVLIPVSVGGSLEGLVSGGDVGAATPAQTLTLTFTSADWSTPQVVTVHGQDDAVLDGPQSYMITVGKPSSADSNYSALTSKTVTVTNNDNEAGVAETLTLAAASLPHSGQVGKTTDSFYTLSGLVGGVSYRLSATGLTDNANLYVYSNGAFTSLLCSSTASGKTSESCLATTNVDGTIYVKITGSLTVNGAAYTLDANPVQNITIETFSNGSTDLVDTEIYLFDSSDLTTWIGYDDEGGVGSYSKLNSVLESGKTYYLKVQGWSNSTGAYSVWITTTATAGSSTIVTTGPEGEPDDTPATASTLALETVADRFITYGNVDWYVFTVP